MSAGARLTPKEQTQQSKLIQEIQNYFEGLRSGKPVPDPLLYSPKDYDKMLAKLGLALDAGGKLLTKPINLATPSTKPTQPTKPGAHK